MRYNCLRIHPYAKMFVVGLLLYLGETVFFKCSEEGTFTVYVKPLTSATIEVHNCKGTDKLSVFMKKFEEAFDTTYINVKIKDWSYNLIYKSQNIVVKSEPVEDETLAALGIGENSILNFIKFYRSSENPVKLDNHPVVSKGENEDFINFDEKNIKGKRRNSIDSETSKGYPSLQSKFDIGPRSKEISRDYGSEDENGKYTKSKHINSLELLEKLLQTHNTEKEKSSSTSTCPLRRCCRICGC